MQNLSYENKFDVHGNEHTQNTFPREWFLTKICFNAWAKGNSSLDVFSE